MNFKINSTKEISSEFLNRTIYDFTSALDYIQTLAYKRNNDKSNLLSVFREQCGTCSTKHALLKTLCIENEVDEIKLYLGIYYMNGMTMPEVAATLTDYNLNCLPEAHCYLRVNDEIIDITKINWTEDNFRKDLKLEIEIDPGQITDFKNNFHKNYLLKWLSEYPEIDYSPEQLWEIREKCVEDLQKS